LEETGLCGILIKGRVLT